jgi:hypothetical protein
MNHPTMKKQCVCYACTEHSSATPSEDPWVNIIRIMIRDGRLVHTDTDENGNNVYSFS